MKLLENPIFLSQIAIIVSLFAVFWQLMIYNNQRKKEIKRADFENYHKTLVYIYFGKDHGTYIDEQIAA